MNLVVAQDERIGVRRLRHQDEEQGQTAHARTLPLAALALVAAGCNGDLETLDPAFYAWDGRAMHCPVEADTKAGNSLADLERGLDRAKERGEVLEILVHTPGVSMPWDEFDALLAAIDARGLSWVTYEDMAHGIEPVAGVALQYDGTYLDSWMQSREYLARYGARVTIFVTRYHRLNPDRRAILRQLHDDGHDLEAHAVNHLRGPLVVEEQGMEYYLDDEVQPSIDILRDDGYEVVSYAYPFGARTDEIDEAVGARVPLLRSLVLTSTLVPSPCPL